MKIHLEERDENMTQIMSPVFVCIFNTQNGVGVVVGIMKLNFHVGF
jgi:hypothetical protein